MNKYFRRAAKFLAGAAVVAGFLGFASPALANPYIVYQGGTGTSTTPLAGQVLSGNTAGTYGPVYLVASGTVVIATSSNGGITITGNGASLTAFSATNPITYNSSTGVFGWTNSNNYITLTSLSASSPITYNSSTGAFACPSCIVSIPTSTITINGISTSTFQFLAAGTGLAVASSGNSITYTWTNPGYITTSTFNATGTPYYFPFWGSGGNSLAQTSNIYENSTTQDITIGSTTDLGGPFSIIGTTPSIHVQYTGTAQYQGAGFQLGGPLSLGSEGQTYIGQQNISPSGATQGGFTINQETATGTFVGTVLNANYDSSTVTIQSPTKGIGSITISSSGAAIIGNATTTNLTITGLGSSGNPCLDVGTGGAVATTTCGATGATTTVTASGTTLNGPAFTFASSSQVLPYASGTSLYWVFASNNISQFTNNSGYLTSAPATTTINGYQSATFNINGTGNVTSTGSNGTTTFSLTGVIPAINGGTGTTTALGSAAFTPASNYLPSSTAYVSTFNGASGAVTGLSSLNGSTGTYNLYAGGILSIATGTASSTISLSTTTLNTQVAALGFVTSTGSSNLTSTYVGVGNGSNLLSGTGALTFSSNLFTVGGTSTSTISGSATTTSVIQSLNNIQYVPANFATVGCAGSSTATTFQGCVYAIYSSMASIGGGTIWVTNDVTSTWTGPLSFNINGDQVSFNCTANTILQYNGTGTALNFNFGNPIGHAQTSDSGGCDLRGQSSLVVAGQSNNATTTGILYGGNLGAVGVNVDYNINGFGTNIEVGSNAYLDNFTGSDSGGNGGVISVTGTTSNGTSTITSVSSIGSIPLRSFVSGTGIPNNTTVTSIGTSTITLSQNATATGTVTLSFAHGSLLQFDIASNSGERNDFNGGSYTDPGNSSATNAIYIFSGAAASTFIDFNSLDDAQVYVGSSNGQVSISNDHIENPDGSQYGPYIQVVNPSSDRSTEITFSNNEIANDFSGANSFPTIIKHGAQLYAVGNHIDNYGGGTITNFSDHSNDNGVESEMICQTQVNGGALTNLVAGGGGISYSLATGNGCVYNNGNSYTIGMVANANNVNDFYSGNSVVATFDHSGDWTFGVSGSTASFQFDGNLNASGTISSNGTPVVLNTTQVNSGGILTGGGALSSNQTISLSTSTLYSEFSGTAPVTFNTSTGAIACPTCLTTGSSYVSSINGTGGAYNIYAGGILSIATGTGSSTISLSTTTLNTQVAALGYVTSTPSLATTTIAASGTTLNGPAFTFASSSQILPFASGTALYWNFATTSIGQFANNNTYVLQTTQVNSGGILSGGGALSGNQTISLSTSTLNTQVAALGYVTSTGAASTTINGVTSSTFHIIGDGTTITSTQSGATTTFSFLNTAGYLTNASITANAPITWSGGNVIGFNTSTPLTLGALYTFNSGIVSNGNVTSTSFTSNSTTTTQILDFNNIINFPQNFATAGCLPYATSTDFGTCVNDIYASFPSSTWSVINLPPMTVSQANWLTAINFNRNGVSLNFVSSGGTTLQYGGTGVAITLNTQNPTGHLQTQFGGFNMMGQSTLIAAGNTNTATSTGIVCGGGNGCVGVLFYSMSINGFGIQIHQTSNAYVNTYQNISLSGGNGLTQGNCFLMDTANNSGERNVLNGVNCFDPGNSTTTGQSIYLTGGAAASTYIQNLSLDDAIIYDGYSNGDLGIDKIHIENPDCSAYGAYIPIYATSSASSMISIGTMEIANDCSGATGFATIIKHGIELKVNSWHLDNYGGGTVNLLSDHSLNNGSESESICGGSVSGGSLTNIVSNQAYSQAVAIGCVQDTANSYPYTSYIDGSNVVHFRNGNGDVATVGNNGNWTFSNNGTPGSVTITGTLSTSGNTTIGGTFNVTSTASFQATSTFLGNISSTIANALIYGNGSGIFTAYGGSSCSGGQAANGISATGTVTGCFTPSGGSGSVSTSSAITPGNFPFWNSTTGQLTGTSSISQNTSTNKVSFANDVSVEIGTLYTHSVVATGGNFQQQNNSGVNYFQGTLSVSTSTSAPSGFQFFVNGSSTFNGALAINTTTVPAGYLINAIGSNSSSTGGAEINIQDTASSSYGEYVVTEDTGNASSGFVGFGINNSTLAPGIELAGDGYLEGSSTGGFDFEVSTSSFRFFGGIGASTTASNTWLTIASSGISTIKTLSLGTTTVNSNVQLYVWNPTNQTSTVLIGATSTATSSYRAGCLEMVPADVASTTVVIYMDFSVGGAIQTSTTACP